MTVVAWEKDQRSLITGGVLNYWDGFVTARNSNGADRTPADKLAGLWPDHAYSATHTREYWGQVMIWEFTNFGKVLIRKYLGSNGGNSYNPSNSLNSNDDIVALGRLANQIRLHDWNAGIFVAELGKTTDTIANRTRQLASAVSSVKKGKVRQAVNILGAQPRGKLRARSTWYETWLELRYAWRPLVKDVFDLSEAIKTFDAPRKTVIRSSYKKEFSVTYGDPNFLTVGLGRHTIRYKYTFSEPPLTLQSHLGLHDPDEVAWEIMPYSFVADWFIPIGSYIRTRNVLQKTTGSYVRTACTSYDCGVRVNPTSNFYWGKQFLSNNASVYSNPTSRKRRMQLTRSIGAYAPPIPLPMFRNPIGANPGTRVLDAIALLTAAVKR